MKTTQTLNQVCARAIILAALLLMLRPGHACDVPVFRYALERWPVDPYQLVVEINQPLSSQEAKVVATFEEIGFSGDGILNVRLHRFSRGETPAAGFADLLPARQPGAANQLHVFYPHSADIRAPVWSGPVSNDSLNQIMKSRSRADLTQQILKGSSAVFVLLESGDAEKDKSTLKFLQTQARALSKTFTLPDSVVDTRAASDGAIALDPSNQLQSAIPFRIHFSVISVPRKASEALFVNTLLGLEPDLTEIKGQPMMFTVYGRGRALMPLVGDGIEEDLLTQIAGFLTGRCSCQVKYQNPGTDLLLQVDWETVLYADDTE